MKIKKLICCFGFGLLMSFSVHAGMVTNQQEFNAYVFEQHVTVDEVIKTLEDRGLASPNLEVRLSSMSQKELAQLQSDFERLPAGAGIDTITAVLIGAGLLVMSDYMGFTDVFPFIKPQKEDK